MHYVSDLAGRPDALREVRDGCCSDDIRKLRGAKDIGDGIDTVLAEARTRITAWQEDCNRIMPHSSPGNRAPEECAVRAGPAMKAA
ncbi:MAG: hypothetical protein R3D59_06495 [Paracoccaceae bacterium]